MADTCWTCEFWCPLDGETGACHVHAPQRILADVFHASDDAVRQSYFRPEQLPAEAIWPLTQAGDFCGEYEVARSERPEPPKTLRLPHVASDSEKIAQVAKRFGPVPFNRGPKKTKKKPV